jgi:hypothetical protein
MDNTKTISKNFQNPLPIYFFSKIEKMLSNNSLSQLPIFSALGKSESNPAVCIDLPI